MGNVVCFSSGGVRCAVPARQVLRAEELHGAVRDIELWPAVGGRAESGGEVTLIVDIGCGYARLRVCGVSLDSISADRIHSLPVILRDKVPFHVVGLMEICAPDAPGTLARGPSVGGDPPVPIDHPAALLWLVDLKRYRLPTVRAEDPVESRTVA